MSECRVMKVALDQQNRALSLFRQSRRKVKGDSGLSVMRQGAADQQTLHFSCIPQLPQTHPQGSEAIGRRTVRIGLKDDAAGGLNMSLYNGNIPEVKGPIKGLGDALRNWLTGM